ncbi:MAG TPA: hypothetical protein VFT81_02265 [Dermatophilaceae bacterium]|nr:hypothetical protein [Dermatophilaceae bacterium]
MKRRYPAQSTLRRVAAAVVAISALTLAGGCSITNPRETTGAYLPADGVAADIGTVALRDLVLISDGEDTAVLAGSALNTGDDKVTVQFSPQGESTAPAAEASDVELAAREQLVLSTKGLQFKNVTAKPGRLLPVTVRSSEGGTIMLRVPVLAATGAYSTITPAG